MPNPRVWSKLRPVSLVLLGWICFLAAVVTQNSAVRFLLLVAARALPHVLSSRGGRLVPRLGVPRAPLLSRTLPPAPRIRTPPRGAIPQGRVIDLAEALSVVVDPA